jgi:hypothetical protein
MLYTCIPSVYLMCTHSEHSMECSTVFSICNYPITASTPVFLLWGLPPDWVVLFESRFQPFPFLLSRTWHRCIPLWCSSFQLELERVTHHFVAPSGLSCYIQEFTQPRLSFCRTPSWERWDGFDGYVRMGGKSSLFIFIGWARRWPFPVVRSLGGRVLDIRGILCIMPNTRLTMPAGCKIGWVRSLR